LIGALKHDVSGHNVVQPEPMCRANPEQAPAGGGAVGAAGTFNDLLIRPDSSKK